MRRPVPFGRGPSPDERLNDVSAESIVIGGIEGAHSEFGNGFDEGCQFVIDGFPSGHPSSPNAPVVV